MYCDKRLTWCWILNISRWLSRCQLLHQSDWTFTFSFGLLSMRQDGGSCGYITVPLAFNMETPNTVVVAPVLFNPRKTDLQSQTVFYALRYLLFHVANAALGITGLFTAVFGVLFSVALLSLCCLGLSVLKMVAVTLDVLAWLDIHLANTITDQNSQLQSSKECAIQSNANLDLGCTSLAQLTRRQMVTLLYFLVIKACVSTLSIIVVSWSVVLPIQILTGAKATVISCATERIHG